MHESVFDPWLTSFVRCVMSGFGGKVEIAPTMSAYNPNRTARQLSRLQVRRLSMSALNPAIFNEIA
jgi:hypothetical protein